MVFGLPAERNTSTASSLSLMAYSKIIELRNKLKELAQATKVAQLQGDQSLNNAFVETCSYLDGNDLITLLSSDLELFRLAQEILQPVKVSVNMESLVNESSMPSVDFEQVLFDSEPM